jgi:predicted kinase
MRKWMRDKLKGRKKAPQEAGAQPAPLQPAYFEPQSEPGRSEEQQRAEPVTEAHADITDAVDAEPRMGAASDSDPGSDSDSATATAAQAGTGSQSAGATGRPRRRRGRGGRGRRRPGTSALPASKPPSAAIETAAGETAPTPASITAPTAASNRPSKGTVVLAIGLPGSGKSSWFKRNNISPLSSDLVRSLLFDNPDEQRFQDLVFSNLRSMLRARLIARRPMNYVDATNLTPHERSSWIKLAKDSGYEAQALYFDVPLDVCLERNQKRQRVVSEDIMRKMSAKLKPPTFDEGFSKITVVRVKQKE